MNTPAHSVSNSNVRVRFAPSPTGWLHIGGVRTALFNYLFAKQTGGKFLMRIEDTDLDRSEQRFTDDILSSLKWLGMDHEEEILYQSKRLDLYKKIADDLVKQDLAYYCYATEEEVEAGRQRLEKEGKKPMYDRAWRDRKAHLNPPSDRTSYAIRAKFPLTGTTAFADMIRGEISFPNEDMDDFVMIRSNGVPTYNFVVVIDDIEMKISHVIRGDDHINNTPKQVYIYDALKTEKPLFAHLPMILGQDKKKLSKRNGETSTNAYRNEGYLPEALLNFLVRLGWSHGDQELFSIQEMIEFFGLNHVQVSGAVFNQEKLLWIQAEHIRKADPTRLVKILQSDFADQFSADSLKRLATPMGIELVKHVQQKAKLIKELAHQMHPLLEPKVMAVDASGLKWNKDPAQKEKIKAAISALTHEMSAQIEKSGKSSLHECGVDHTQVDAALRALAERFELKLGDLTQPLRLFVTGQAASAIGLFDLLPVLDWAVIKARLEACLQS
jgi:glutamyl-tRNA synthetase